MKAILTGHTRGLGAAIAAELLARSIPVLGAARQYDEKIAEKFPDLIKQYQVDLADLTALKAWLERDEIRQFSEEAGTLLLINNAGMLGPIGPLNEQDSGAISRSVTLNVAAPLIISSAIAGLHKGELRIAHLSSGAARNAYPGWSIYCATKAALDHHARAVTLDSRPNLKICSLAPGVIDTDMQAEIRCTSAEQFPLRDKFVALKRDGKLATARQVAHKLVGYLISDQFGSDPVADLRDLPDPGQSMQSND